MTHTATTSNSEGSTTQTPAKNDAPPSPFASAKLENLCSETAGAKIVFATDEWFAAADNLLKNGPPLFISDLYCEEGKVMDGWETRRRREAGHDWCIIKLGHQRARVECIELDTAHFTGNHVPQISLLGIDMTWTQEKEMIAGLPGAIDRLLHGGLQGTGHTPEEVKLADELCNELEWTEMLPKTPLNPGFEETRMHYFKLDTPVEATHLRLNYFPDGGVARFKVWGTPLPRISPRIRPPYIPIRTGPICTVVLHSSVSSEEELPSRQINSDFIEVSSETLGGVGVACSNKHFGEPWQLLQPGLGKDMGDGWETARHPDRPSVLVKDPNTQLIDSPLMDWAILRLGKVATNGVARVILDTKHFRGNYPESVQVDGCFASDGSDSTSQEWFPLIGRTRMAPDAEHVFDRSLQQIVNSDKPMTHVRVCIYPDGGLSRVRIYTQE